MFFFFFQMRNHKHWWEAKQIRKGCGMKELEQSQ